MRSLQLLGGLLPNLWTVAQLQYGFHVRDSITAAVATVASLSIADCRWTAHVWQKVRRSRATAALKLSHARKDAWNAFMDQRFFAAATDTLEQWRFVVARVVQARRPVRCHP